MAKKPTYEELEQRVKELERETVERKQAEKDRERLFKAIEIAKEAVSIQSPDLITVYANDAMEKLFGYEKGELIGKHVSILDADATSEATMRQIVEGIEKDGYWEGEVHNKRKNGSEILTYAATSAIKDRGGKIINFISTQHDITDRTRAQEALKESEEEIRLTVENAPLGIGTVYLDGRFRTMNQAYCDMLGYSSEELSNMTFDDISHPDDREKSHKALKDLLDRKVARLEFEKRYIHKDGSVVDVIQRGGIVYDSSGNPLFIIGISEDVTEKKKLETQLQEAKKMEAIATLALPFTHKSVVQSYPPLSANPSHISCNRKYPCHIS